jgi:RNA polymerase sigma factor (sigma-70 family)
MPEEPFWTERRVRAALEWYREMSAVIAEGFDTRLIGADDFDAQMSIRFLGELGRIRRGDPGGCRRPRGEARAPAVYALAEAKADLDRAIVALPGRLRRVVIRHYRDGLMTHEIAQEIHASPSTVRTHLERARKKILLFLEPLVDATP